MFFIEAFVHDKATVPLGFPKPHERLSREHLECSLIGTGGTWRARLPRVCNATQSAGDQRVS